MLIVTLFVPKMFSKVQKKKKQTSIIAHQSSNTITTPDSTPQITKEPVYDDIELACKISTIDLSKNIAYVCTKK